jgi:uncharacterized protein YndB with AHSA1/START domain
MTEASQQRHIARPVDEVWDALADFGAISRWSPDADHSCLLTDQRSGVGTTRRVQVGRMTLVERVTTWDPDPPCALAYEIEGLPAALGRVSNRWVLDPIGTGTTATLTTRVEGSSRPLKVVARVAAARMARASASMLAGLDHSLTTTKATA